MRVKATSTAEIGGSIVHFTNNGDSTLGIVVSNTGSEELIIFARINGYSIQTFSAPGIYEGEHYVTVSYDASEKLVSVYYDGELIGSYDRTATTDGVSDVSTATGYIGKYADLGDSNGAGQFFGTIYNVNIKTETTSLEAHIEEAYTNSVLVETSSNLTANYILSETGVTNAASSTSVLATGLGDSYLATDGGITLTVPELSAAKTVELVVSAEDTDAISTVLNLAGVYVGYVYENGTGYYVLRDMDYSSRTTDTNAVTSPYYVEVGGKNRLTVTLDGDIATFYVDGNYVGYVDGITAGSASNTCKIGTEKNYFTGSYYDVKTWSTVLSELQVRGTVAYDMNMLTSHYDFSDLYNGYYNPTVAGGSTTSLEKNAGSYINLQNKVGTTSISVATSFSTNGSSGLITGQYPVLDGTASSYFTTASGVVDTAEKFRVEIEYAMLDSYTNTSVDKTDSTYDDSLQSVVFGLRHATVSADETTYGANYPVFIFHTSSSKEPYLYTSSSGGTEVHDTSAKFGVSVSEIYNLDFTVNLGGTITDNATNGFNGSGYWCGGTPYSSDGSFAIGSRITSNTTQNAHMILYSLKIYQDTDGDGVEDMVLQYDGTRNANGDLIDISGNGNNATAGSASAITWVTDETVIEETILSGGSIGVTGETVNGKTAYEYALDEVTQNGEDVLYMTNIEVQGKVYLHVWLTDALGNVSQVTYGPFDYDTTAPEVNIAAVASGNDAKVSLSASDNWYLGTETGSTNTTVYTGVKYASVVATSEVADPSTLFDASSWTSLTDAGTAWSESLTLSNISGSTDAADDLCYYVALVATDWLGNETSQYLFISKDTLIDDNIAPTIVATVKNAGEFEKAKYVYVSVTDAGGTDIAGVNEATLQYAWSDSVSTPTSGWTAFSNNSYISRSGVTGTYYLHIKANDNVGNTSAAYYIAVAGFDNTAPTVSLSASTTAATNNDVVITVSVTAEAATDDKGSYAIVSNNELAASGTSGNAFTVQANGTYSFTVTDSVGNSTTKIITIENIDKTAPTVSINTLSTGYSSESINVSVSSSDNVGVSSLSYSILNNGVTTTGTISGGIVSIADGGTNVLTVTAVDTAGNTSAATQTYYIDGNTNAISFSNYETDAAKSHSVSVTIGSTTSGEAKAVYYGWSKVDDVTEDVAQPTSWTTAGSNTSFVASFDGVNGSYYLFVKVVSQTGVETVKSVGAFEFDNTSPTVTDDNITLSTTGWTNQDITITFTVETGATVALNGSETASNPFVITENGTYVFTVTDSVGNSTEKTVVVSNIDKTIPQTPILSAIGSEVTNWKVSAVATDGESGIKEYKYYSDENLSKSLETTDGYIIFTEDGEHSVYAVAVDNAGNQSASVSGSYVIDTTPPALEGVESEAENGSVSVSIPSIADAKEVTATVNGISATVSKNQDGTYSVVQEGAVGNSEYQIVITVTDEYGNSTTITETVKTQTNPPTEIINEVITQSSFAASVVAGENNSSPAVYTYTLTVKDGSDTYTYKSEQPTTSTSVDFDLSPQISESAEVTLQVATDGTDYILSETYVGSAGSSIIAVAPTINVESTSPTLISGSETSVVTIGGSASDGNGDELTVYATVSGVKKETTVLGGVWSLAWSGAEVYEGEYQATVYVTDGEFVALAQSETFTVDKTAPAAAIITQDTAADNKFIISGASEGDTIKYTLDGTTWTEKGVTASDLDQDGNVTIEIQASGTQTLQVTICDSVANESTVTSYKFTIDTTAPVVKISGDTSSWSSVSQTATIEISDDLEIKSAGYFVSEKGDLNAEEITGWTAIAISDTESMTKEVTISVEGSWYVYAYVTDYAQTAYAQMGTFGVDKTAPVIAGVASENITSSGFDITWTSITDVSGVDVFASVGGSSDNVTVAENKISVKNLAGNAEHEVVITMQDGAGNVSYYQTSVTTLASGATKVTFASKTASSVTVDITASQSNVNNAFYKVIVTAKDSSGSVATYESEYSTATTATVSGLPSGWVISNIQVETQNSDDENVSISETIYASVAPVLSVTDVDNATVFAADGIIIIKGTIIDSDTEDVYISATIDNITKSTTITGTSETAKDWELSWNIESDNVCYNAYGEFDVTVSAVDASGNKVSASAGIVSVDNKGAKAPELETEIASVVKGGENESYTITFKTGEDNGSAGVASYGYAVDNGEAVTASGDTIGDITVFGDGEHTVVAWYVDANGNTGESAEITFTIDTAAPVVTFKLETFSQTQASWIEVSTLSDSWFNSELRATVSVDDSDAIIKIDVTQSSTAGDFANIGEASVVYIESGTSYVHIYAADEVGNETIATYGSFSIDDTAIETTSTLINTDYLTSNSGTITVPENQSEEAELVSVDYVWTTAIASGYITGGWINVYNVATDTLASEYQVSTPDDITDGLYYLYTKSTDAAGNEYISRSGSFTIDKTAPTIDIVEGESSNVSAAVTLTFADENELVRSEYLFGESAASADDFTDENGDSTATYISSGELVMSQNGVYTFFAKDAAGNTYVATHTVSGIDTQAPTIEGTVSSGWITSATEEVDKKFTFTFEDNAGIAAIGYVDVNNSTVEEYEYQYDDDGNILLDDNGDAILGISTIDYNRMSTIFVDTTAGTFDSSIFAEMQNVSGTEVTFTVGFGDFDDCDMIYEEDGNIYLHFVVIDTAGNMTYQSFGTYQVDTTAPEVVYSGTADEDGNEYIHIEYTTDHSSVDIEEYLINDIGTSSFAMICGSITEYDDEGNATELTFETEADEIAYFAAIGEGYYTVEYNLEYVDYFGKGGVYENAITITAYDLAGNVGVTVLDLFVTDDDHPYYGDGEGGYNYINVYQDEDTTYVFKQADFQPEGTENALYEPTELKSITIVSLPENGTLYFNNAKVVSGDEIAIEEISNLTFSPNKDWYGTDSKASFLAKDKLDNIDETSGATTLNIIYSNVNDAHEFTSSFSSSYDILASEDFTAQFTIYDNDAATIETEYSDMTVTAISNGSAVGVVEYIGTNQSGNGEFKVTLTPKKETTSTEEITVTVKDGDYSISQTFTVYIDATSPEISGEKADNWLNAETEESDRIFTFTFTDDIAIAEIAYVDVANSENATYYHNSEISETYDDISSVFTVIENQNRDTKVTFTVGLNSETTCDMNFTGDDEIYLHFAVKDVLGKITYVTFGIYQVDITNPVISSVTEAKTEWHNGSETIQFVASDATSGVYDICVTKNGEAFEATVAQDLLSGEFTAIENGEYVIYVTDTAGNVETATVVVSKIDTTVPVAVIEELPTIDGENGWYEAEITVDITATDDQMVNWEYTTDGGTTWTEGTDSSFDMQVDGEYVIQIRTTDMAGNVTYSETHNIYIDQTNPVISSVTEAKTEWHNGSETIQFVASDATSGVYDICVTKNGEAFEATVAQDLLSGEFTAIENGEYVIYVTDTAGNVETATVVVSKIDTTVPVVEISYTYTWSSAEVIDSNMPTGWVGTLPTITITSEDDIGNMLQSGVVSEKTYVVTTSVNEDNETVIDFGDYVEYSTLTVAGTYYIVTVVKDKVDNTFTSEVQTLKFEPAIKIFLDAMENIDGSSSGSDLAAANAVYEGMTALEKQRILANPDSYAEYNRLQGYITANEAEYAEAEAERAQTEKLEGVIESLEAASNSTSLLQKETALATYENLSDEEKALIEEIEGFDSRVYEDMSSDIEEVYETVALVDDINSQYSAETEAEIQAARDAYDSLSESQKEVYPTTTLEKLEAMEEALTESVAMEEKIEALSSSNSLSEIAGVVADYNSLDSNTQVFVDNAEELQALYEEALATLSNDEKAAHEFEELVASVMANPSIEGIESLESEYAKLSDSQKALLETSSATDYDNLVVNKESANDVLAAMEALAAAEYETAEENLDGIDNVIDIYDIYIAYLETIAGLENQQSLIDSSIIGQYEAAMKVIELIIALEQFAGEMTPEYIAAIEEAKSAYELLNQTGRDVISQVVVEVLSQAYSELVESLNISNTTETKTTNVEIVGMVEKSDTSVLEEIQEAANQTADNMKEEDPSMNIIVNSFMEVVMVDEEPIVLPKTETTATSPMTSVDLYLQATVSIVKEYEDGETEEISKQTTIISVMEEEYMTVKIKLVSGYDLSTLEIHHIHDGGVSELVTDFNVVEENGNNYAVFKVYDFSHFVFYADKLPVSSSSGSALDTSAPVITVVGTVVTVEDENLLAVYVNGEKYQTTENIMIFDLAEFGDGEYEIVAWDRYGRTTTKTVTVSGEVVEEGDSTVTDVETPSEPETPTATPTPEASEESSSFPWWILIVIVLGTCGYIYYKKKKGSEK